MISKDHMIRDKDGGKNEYKKNTTPSKNTKKLEERQKLI